MRNEDEIFEQAKGLPATVRRRVGERLIESAEREEQAGAVAKKEHSEEERMAALDGFLKLAGTGHSEFTDVSRHKGKHLAEIYAPKRQRK